jgi:hypothetical protein
MLRAPTITDLRERFECFDGALIMQRVRNARSLGRLMRSCRCASMENELDAITHRSCGHLKIYLRRLPQLPSQSRGFVAQLDKAPAYGAGDCGFESRRDLDFCSLFVCAFDACMG